MHAHHAFSYMPSSLPLHIAPCDYIVQGVGELVTSCNKSIDIKENSNLIAEALAKQ